MSLGQAIQVLLLSSNPALQLVQFPSVGLQVAHKVQFWQVPFPPGEKVSVGQATQVLLVPNSNPAGQVIQAPVVALQVAQVGHTWQVWFPPVGLKVSVGQA